MEILLEPIAEIGIYVVLVGAMFVVGRLVKKGLMAWSDALDRKEARRG